MNDQLSISKSTLWKGTAFTLLLLLLCNVLFATKYIGNSARCETSTWALSDDTHVSIHQSTQLHPSSMFDRAVDVSHNLIDPTRSCSGSNCTEQQQQHRPPRIPPVPFDLQKWDQKTSGGLTDHDRVLLGKLYGAAYSVFEYGLGESTYIANAVQVPRYAGIDSDAAWVAMARDKVSTQFRFYFADVGATGGWGQPNEPTLAKNLLHYQFMPLIVEDQPFDVYMVDGRWRMPCMIASFLHASARGGDPTTTIVLLHDCVREEHWDAKLGEFPSNMVRPSYRSADHLLDLVQHSGFQLCVYKRKPATTDEELYDYWFENYLNTS